MKDYFGFTKEINHLETRTEIINYNNFLNGNAEFKKLSNGERYCLKCNLYSRFKLLGYRDSKNFSFLIAMR